MDTLFYTQLIGIIGAVLAVGVTYAGYKFVKDTQSKPMATRNRH